MPIHTLGKVLIGMGLVIIGVGLMLLAAGKIPWLGRLPGDILIRKGNVSFYFPLATSILVSVILTLLFRLFNHR